MTAVAGDIATKDKAKGFGPAQYWICLQGIVWREALRFLHQRERFVSALVRPLVWLFIFAAGFFPRGLDINPPYETYTEFNVYLIPGLIGMIQLFNGMQSSLSLVYDRETGNMRTLLVSPFPRWYLLTSKLLAGTAVSILQVYAFLIIAAFWELTPPTPWGYLTVLPALMLSGMMLGALGMLLSSLIKQLENFAGIMNFVIFPMFFASYALRPEWLIQQSNPFLVYICRINPFTHAVEFIRFALWQQFSPVSFAVVLGCTCVFLAGAIIAYDPARGMLLRRGGPSE
jgi:ABC-2 type transport system permease protein